MSRPAGFVCRTPHGRPSHVCPIAIYTLPGQKVPTDAWQLRLHQSSGRILDFEALRSFLCYSGCIDDQVCTQAMSLQVAADINVECNIGLE